MRDGFVSSGSKLQRQHPIHLSLLEYQQRTKRKTKIEMQKMLNPSYNKAMESLAFIRFMTKSNFLSEKSLFSHKKQLGDGRFFFFLYQLPPTHYMIYHLLRGLLASLISFFLHQKSFCVMEFLTDSKIGAIKFFIFKLNSRNFCKE